MWICNRCNTNNSDTHTFCKECSLRKAQPSAVRYIQPKTLEYPPVSDNHCNNPTCKSNGVILNDSRQKYCGICGSATTYQQLIDELT